MCNDIELLVNLINMTNAMKELLMNNIDVFIECQKLLDCKKIKNVKEIKNIDNKEIKKAIDEILNNNRFIEIIKKQTEIDINVLKQVINILIHIILGSQALQNK